MSRSLHRMLETMIDLQEEQNHLTVVQIQIDALMAGLHYQVARGNWRRVKQIIEEIAEAAEEVSDEVLEGDG